MKKPILVTLGISAVSLSLAALTGSHYFYNLAVSRGKKEFLSQSEDLVWNTQTIPTPTIDPIQWLKQMPTRSVNLSSQDHLQLNALYLPASTYTTKTVILAHGYSSKGVEMASHAKFFHETLGYNILLPDARGHGDSDGHYSGFGWHDRLDYLQWIDYLIAQNGEKEQIVLLGVSMGGATVMMVSGEKLPSQVKAIIEDCGYSSVDAQLSYQLKRMYKLPSFPLLQATSAMTKLKAGYDFYEASALNQVKKATVPMFFIHGDADTFVPTDMVYALYDQCASKKKDLWIVEGAGHAMAYSTAKDLYIQKINDFLTPLMVDEL